MWVAISDWPRLLVGISFYSPHGTSWKHLPWHSLQQLESTKMNQLIAWPSKPVECRKRRDNKEKESQQVMSAHSLVPQHSSHRTFVRVAKSLSFHNIIVNSSKLWFGGYEINKSVQQKQKESFYFTRFEWADPIKKFWSKYTEPIEVNRISISR